MNNEPVVFITEFSRAALRTCKNDTHAGYVDAWNRNDGVHCVPLYLKAPQFNITDDQAERILALVKGEQWRNKIGAGGVGLGKALMNALDEILTK